MTCWEVLGISPTNNREQIEHAYTSQRKFASGDGMQELDNAYHQALREAGFAVTEPKPLSQPESIEGLEKTATAGKTAPSVAAPLNARDQQVVREVVIQVEAMLHDNHRRNDPNIWRAILTEPPADQEAIREATSDTLYPRLKPLLDDRSLPEPVMAFLAQWFGWPELDEAISTAQESTNDPFDDPFRRVSREQDVESETASEERPSMPNFLPAAIGWIAGLVILTSIFSHLLGS